MKEAYFKQENLQILSAQWMERYSKPQKALRQPFNLENAGFLVLDMQRYFVEKNSHAHVPSAAVIIPGLNAAARYFRKAGRPVIATQHINTPENAGMMASWWSELILEDHPLVGLVPELDVNPGELLQKTQYDAFFETELESRLKEQDVKQVVIGGVMTHLCCEMTARSAFVRGFEVYFLVDGTATYNREYHQAALLNLAHGTAVLTTIDQITKE